MFSRLEKIVTVTDSSRLRTSSLLSASDSSAKLERESKPAESTVLELTNFYPSGKSGFRVVTIKHISYIHHPVRVCLLPLLPYRVFQYPELPKASHHPTASPLR